VRVLYVNHTATVSGAERSLLDLLGALPGEVSATLAAPAGTLSLLAQERGVPLRRIRGTAGSLRLHPLHTPQALAEMAIAAGQVRRAVAALGTDVVHANSIRAGIVCGLARPRAATVVHIRDCLPAGRVSVATMKLIAATAGVAVANSEYTARWARTVAPRIRVEVVHNGVDLARFDPARIDRDAARHAVGAREPTLLLGVVAQLSPWKGQDTAIEALAGLLEQGVDAHLALIGAARFVASATRFDNEAYVSRLKRLAEERGVADRVLWLGEREDVAELIRALDLLLLPSWEEPFGRAVIEAMALEVPVLATEVGGPAEILAGEHGGLLLDPRDPPAWARAAAALAAAPERRAELGRLGRERAEREFTLERHAGSILAVYERTLGRDPNAA
jgi:glycosyltransferase involved in cell wall biosynthesis